MIDGDFWKSHPKMAKILGLLITITVPFMVFVVKNLSISICLFLASSVVLLSLQSLNPSKWLEVKAFLVAAAVSGGVSTIIILAFGL